jgi:hypothetical protein
MTFLKAKRTEWITSRIPETVIVSPNITASLALSWLCEHVGPQMPTENQQIIACSPCLEALIGGAEIAYDM